jgi:aldose sugar dehydrogenase
VLRSKSVFVAFLIAQTWIPQQQACDKTRVPAPGPDPWANVPVTNQATTADGVRIGVQVLLTNLQIPWSLVFAPDGRMFFTERVGRVRVVQSGQLLEQPAFTFGDVFAGSESGVLGMALHPAFAQNHFVYVVYTAVRSDGARVNRLVRFRESNNVFGEAAVLLDNIPAATTHAGSRIRFGPDGKLYVSTGDAQDSNLAQTLSSLGGKILRLNDDGTTPSDNPYGSPVWTWGHRHPQGIDWHPTTGDMWATEHGNLHQDELNRIVKGNNYGWPIIQGDNTRPDMIAPVLFYVPAIAPSGLSFYTSTRIPQFRANIFFTALGGMHIHRVRLDPADATRVAATERLFESTFGRIRDIVPGPDGALYFTTSNRDGRTTPAASDDRIARIVPIQ